MVSCWNSGHCSPTYYSAASRITHATETFLPLARRAKVSCSSRGRLTGVRMLLLALCALAGRFVSVAIVQSIAAEGAPRYTIWVHLQTKKDALHARIIG